MGVRQELLQEQQRAEGRVEAGEMTESQRRGVRGREKKRWGEKGMIAEVRHLCSGCSEDLGSGAGGQEQMVWMSPHHWTPDALGSRVVTHHHLVHCSLESHADFED